MDAVTAGQPDGHESDVESVVLRAVLDIVTDAVVVLDADGRVSCANEALHALVGGTPHDAAALDELLPRAEGEPVFHRALRGMGGSDLSVKHGRTGARLAVTAHPVLAGDELRGVVAVLRPAALTDDDETAAGLVDGLTGVASLDGLVAYVEAQLAAGRADLAVLRVDIERFRGLNERLGKEAGDEVLRQLADILGRSVRGDDFVARIGGGEFAVAYHGVGDAQLLAVINRVSRLVCTELTVGGQSLPVTCNVAAATVLPGDDANTLLQRADARRPRVMTGSAVPGRPLVRR